MRKSSTATSLIERPLLDTPELRWLERLGALSLQTMLAVVSGQRPSGEGATDFEFADYRPYVPGDDLRYVDWNVRARLRELLVKVAPAERGAEIDILIDTSRSMDFGDSNKLHHARRLAVALGAVALLHTDVVRTFGLADGQTRAGPRLEAPGMVGALSDQVASLPAGVLTNLPEAVHAYRCSRVHTDLVVLISDGLVPPAALTAALTELASAAPRVAFVHILDPAELRVPDRGPLALRDCETGLVLDLSAPMVASYAQLAEYFRVGVERRVRALGVCYLPAPTEVEPLELLGARAAGLLAV